MTELSQPEIDAAKNIGLMPSGLPVDRVSFAYKHAVKFMIARLLQSGWDLRSACDHALACGDLVVAEIAAVRQSPKVH